MSRMMSRRYVLACLAALCGMLGFLLIRSDDATQMENSPMFYNLCQNEDFKKQFTTTFMDLVNTAFTVGKQRPYKK